MSSTTAVDGAASRRPTPRPVGGEGEPVAHASLSLLGSFELRCGDEPISLPFGTQRLLAFLALRNQPLLRVHVAGMLWLDTTDERASANLRSSLWRLQRTGHRLVDATTRQLRMAEGVRVDVHDATAAAHRLLAGRSRPEDLEPAGLRFADELLSDWYDDWVHIERERFRQLGLHALEALSEQLVARGRLMPALEAAVAAVAGEPLRESAHRALIRVHLAEGNAGEALRQYRLCRTLLKEQIGVEPSPQLDRLVEGLTV